MWGLIVSRLLRSVLVLVGISVILYVMMRAIPGGPLAMYLHGGHVTKAEIARLRQSFGLNQPVWKAYIAWLWSAVHGNFGDSYLYGLPATTLLMQRLPNSLILMLPAFALAVCMALASGVLAAVHHGDWLDYTIDVSSYVGMAIPIFWLGLLMIEAFATGLHWFPVGGMANPGQVPTFETLLPHLVLPALVLAIFIMSSESRYVRSSMLDALHTDYIRTARAKGAPELRVVIRHALRNALIPVITVMIMDGAFLFGGALVTETVFSWPGMGRLFLQAVEQGDYPVIMAEVAFLSVIIVLANIVADVLYAVVDPRIHYR